jgi:hypothetical protein
MFYADPEMANFEVFSYDAPYGNQVSLVNPVGGWSNPYSAIAGGDPFPRPFPPPKSVSFVPAAEFYSMKLNMHAPYTQQWNLSIQRQLGADLLLTANYVGNKSTHRWIGFQGDPAVYIPGTWTGAGSCGSLTVAPGPNGTNCSSTGNTQARRVLSLLNPTAGAGIGTIPFNDDAGNAEYNALFLTANRRFSRHFSVLANYTWSHCLSEGEQDAEGGGGSIQNPNDIPASRGNCISDVRQIFNLSYVAMSPHFANRIVNMLFTDWRQAGIMGAQTGNWLIPLDGTDISLTNYGEDRPNVVAKPNLPKSDRTVNAWFNTAAYTKQATGTFGNAGSYSIVGPGSFTYDAQLSRAFGIREGESLEVRFEAFNALNHPVFNNPGTTLSSSSSLGKILTANNPRILQGAMKFVF